MARALSLIVKDYARETGCALRTAQLHAKLKDPRWTEYLAARGASAPGPATTTEQSQPSNEMEARVRERAEMHQLVKTEVVRYLAAGDITMFVTLSRREEELDAAWRAATKDWLDFEKRAGRLVERDRTLNDFRRTLASIDAVLRNMPNELGPRLMPMSPTEGIAAVREWKATRLDPQIAAARAKINSPITEEHAVTSPSNEKRGAGEEITSPRVSITDRVIHA